MDALDLRKTVIDYIKDADERLLNLVKEVVESYQKSDVVALTVNGKPLNKAEYQQALIDAEIEIKEGRGISQEALEKESESW